MRLKSSVTAVTVECEVYEESPLWPQYFRYFQYFLYFPQKPFKSEKHLDFEALLVSFDKKVCLEKFRFPFEKLLRNDPKVGDISHSQ